MYSFAPDWNHLIQEIAALKKTEVQPHILASMDIGTQVKEYCAFLRALKSCQDTAETEYAAVSDKLDEVKNLHNDLDSLKSELQDIVGVESLRLTADQSVEDAKTQGDVANELNKLTHTLTTDFERTLEEIQTKTEEIASSLKNFTVVLFGRTKAGKSTVREALTQGDGKTIGKGGQSTTKENHEYQWHNLRVFDTPGILSMKDTNRDEKDGVGDEERMARELLKQADIVLFMFITDSIDPKALEYLNKDIASQDKDVLILLNVKSSIDNYKMFKLRKKEKELDPKAQQENIDRIRRDGLPPEKAEHIPILPIHAQAGFYSRAKNNAEVAKFFQDFQVTRDELYDLSHFAEIRNYLVKNINEKGRQIRCRTIWKFYIQNIKNLADRNGDPIKDINKTSIGVYNKIKEAYRKVSRKMEDFKKQCETKLLTRAKQEIDTYDFAHDCIEYDYSKEYIKSKWQETLEKNLKDLPKELLQEVMQEIGGILDELKTQLEFDTNVSSQFQGYEIGIDWKKWLNIGVGLGNIGWGIFCTIAAFNSWNVAGWVMWLVAGIGIALQWVVNLFKSKAEKISELREKLDDSLKGACRQIAEKIVEFCEKGNKDENTGEFDGKGVFAEIRRKMEEALSNQEKMNRICFDCRKLSEKLQSKVDEAKEQMERSLKQYQG